MKKQKMSNNEKNSFQFSLIKYLFQLQNKIETLSTKKKFLKKKINICIFWKMKSITFNIIQFFLDSNIFNNIIYDIFKYCQINEEIKETGEIKENKKSGRENLSFENGNNKKNGTICTDDYNLISYLDINSNFYLWK